MNVSSVHATAQCGGQRKTGSSQFLPSTMWILGFELRLLSLAASSFTSLDISQSPKRVKDLFLIAYTPIQSLQRPGVRFLGAGVTGVLSHLIWVKGIGRGPPEGLRTLLTHEPSL